MKKPHALFALAACLAVAPFALADDTETEPTHGAAATVQAPTDFRRSSVVERSPFAKSERARKGGSGDALELRGFFGSGDALQVSITRPDTKETAWVSVGDKNAKWVVETADADAGTAEVNFDGLRLHLTLAKAEVPEVTEARRGGGNRWGGNMSDEGRQALRDAMRSGFEKARTDHPEWFDGRQLDENQQNARKQYMQAGWNNAKEAVAKVSQVDAQQMGAEPPFFGGGGPRQQDNASGTATAAVTVPTQPVQPQTSNDGANTSGNTGNNGNRGNRTNRGTRGTRGGNTNNNSNGN